MSGKFVRASKYRHVFGQEAKKERQYQNVRPNTDGEGNYIAGNREYFAISIQGGGGPVLVHPLASVGRVAHNAPKINVHKQKVVDFDFNPFVNNQIATASEDCTVRIVNFPDGGLKEDINEANAILEGHQKKLALVKYHPTASNVLASCAYDYEVKAWDVSTQQCLFTNKDHNEMLQSLEWNADGSLLGTTCKDKMLRVFDIREAKSAVSKVQGFEGSKSQRMVFMSNRNKMAVVGFSKSSMRQYQIWDPRNLSKALADPVDIDQAAGVIVPWYDPDTCMLYLGGKGDGNIKYFEIVDEEPYCHFLSDYRSSESQKGVCFLPKLACDTKTCDVAIALRLMRDSVVPISFQVPRKSELFQKDLYPDTYAGVASMTADEWKSGQNKTPVMKPIQEAQKAAKSSASTAAASGGAKNAAQVQQELDAANKIISEQNEKIKVMDAKIKELEAKIKG